MMSFEKASKYRKSPQKAFEEAIRSGRLTTIRSASNYAGYYMYMGIAVDGTTDAFKHSLTREYIK